MSANVITLSLSQKNDIGHKKICHYYSRMNVNQFHNFEPEISSDTFFSKRFDITCDQFKTQ